MKKIAIMHFAYPPNTGGVEILVKEHATLLVELGLNVTVITGSGEEKNPKIKLVIIPEFQSVINSDTKLQDKILKEGKIDEDFYHLAELIEKKLEENLKEIEVVIVHNMLTIVRNLPFIYAFKKYVENHPEKKYFAWTHDHSYINQFKVKDLNNVAKSQLEKELLTKPINNVNYIAISETFKKPLIQLMNLESEKVTVIYDGLNLQKFLEIDASMDLLRKRYHLFASFPIILSPVNILARKNLLYCIDVVAQLTKYYPNLLYIITGNPSSHRSTQEHFNLLKSKIESLKLQQRVIFLTDTINRYLVDSELHDLYDLSDIIMYLSISENFGLPLLEAGLSKTPIFVSDLEVFHEIANGNINYIDFRTLSPQEAAEIIKNYLENDKIIKNNYVSRVKFDLETILKEKFLPLIT